MIINNITIKEFRKNKGITQKELAVLTGLSYRTIQNYESGGVIPISKHELFRNLFADLEETKVSEEKHLYGIPEQLSYDLVEDLRQQNYLLQKSVKDKEEIITLLKEKLKKCEQ